MRRWSPILMLVAAVIALAVVRPALAQDESGVDEALVEDTAEEPPADEGIVPPIAGPGEEAPVQPLPLPFTRARPPTPPTEGTPIEGGAPGEGETRWNVKINAAIRAHYVFNDSSDNFVIKYRWEIQGQANANTAVIRGDAEISADVEGFLSKWPTGECKLEVGIPKVPFEITFQRGAEDKGSIALQFRRQITEDWQSRCSFADAPGARFDTRGEPEKLLARAIEKARPPLRSIVADIGREESTTSFVINKEVIDDAPLGSIEIEGTGVVTITPGGGG